MLAIRSLRPAPVFFSLLEARCQCRQKVAATPCPLVRESATAASARGYARHILIGAAPVTKVFRYAGLAIVFIWFFVGGIGHFRSAGTFASIVPPYVPFPLAVVYISGVFELLGAIGLCVPRWRQWAGNGLIALTICVTPANVYMWMHPQLFPTISPTLLFWRLPVQVLLLAVIWYSTREPRPDR